jgi:hypothetical protein
MAKTVADVMQMVKAKTNEVKFVDQLHRHPGQRAASP